jgi:hypothetical protein
MGIRPAAALATLRLQAVLIDCVTYAPSLSGAWRRMLSRTAPIAKLLRPVLALAAGLILALAGAAAASAQPVSVYPLPGSLYNRPQEQIAFRGIPASQIGSIEVVGSQSGVHTGTIEADSDGDGGSFLPDKPFDPGETVTVHTHLDIVGASDGTFSFKIANVAPLLSYGRLPLVRPGSDGVQHFRSAPTLEPASVTVLENHAPAADGDIFVAPQFGPLQDGPMILNPQGKLIWFDPYPVSTNTLITDFRVQELYGQPVLTWWQGNTNNGHGRGEGVIYNSHYQQIATVHAADGLDVGLHEFLITNNGDAWIIASSPVNLPGVNKPTIDSVVQEIDIKTGLVLFDWDALDHVPLSESYFTPASPGHIFDPYHANSITIAPNGDPIVSMRNTSAIYEIDRQTGSIVWTLGGKDSSFKMGPGTVTWGQHDAVLQPDGTLTVFDDGGGPPRVQRYSHGIRERIDTANHTATLISQYYHWPELAANFEGSVQPLPGGETFLGWGQQPYFSEYSAQGKQDFDARFTAPTSSYRAYRFSWNGQPLTKPALALVPNADGATELYASWNGATEVASWRVLAGPDPNSLSVVGQAPWSNFETEIADHSAAPYYAVQALSSSGQVLGTSPALATPAHIAIYGHSAFVPLRGGLGGIPASCLQSAPCHIVTSIYAGRTLVARTGREYIGAQSAGIIYFRLTARGFALLRSARGARLPVSVDAQDLGGPRAQVQLNIIGFDSLGRGPARSLQNSPSLRIVGVTDFVSNGWVGGILAGCLQATPCHVTTTLVAGGRTIAHSGSEFLGANELGYLFFRLTPQAHAMIERAPGNQLGASLVISDGQASSRAQVALIPFR